VSARRRRLSASGRVAVTMSLATTAAVIVLCVLAYGITLRNLTAEVDHTLVREASAFSAAVRSAPASEALVAATRAYLSGRSGGQANLSPVLILALEGGRTISNSEIRLDTAPANAALRFPVPTPLFSNVQFDGATYRTLAVPVLATDGKRLGTFQVALTEDSAKELATGVAGALGAAGIVVVLLGSILSIWAARGSLRPLTHMAADASAISLASPGKRMVYDGPPDELGTLANALNAMLERLEHAYAEQRRFVADASHELRTPVAIVRGNVELLRSGKLGGVDALEGLEMIDSESKRMSRLLDELLALARLESSVHSFQPLEVRTILEEGAGRVRLLGEREIRVEGPSGLWTEGDPDLLDQALLNVLKNAFAHTVDGGRITLACAADETRVHLTGTDNGPGIPDDELARIFDRFYRAQGPRSGDSGGAGLGLAIAQRLVDLHGGSMSAENVEGTGARFTITLPRIAEPS
jgi:two-component system OmpR family sensor kinase